MSEKFIPSPENPSYKDYFDDKYGEGSATTSKSNRKANQKAEQEFEPMDGKFTREFARIRHERETKKFGNK